MAMAILLKILLSPIVATIPLLVLFLFKVSYNYKINLDDDGENYATFPLRQLVALVAITMIIIFLRGFQVTDGQLSLWGVLRVFGALPVWYVVCLLAVWRMLADPNVYPKVLGNFLQPVPICIGLVVATCAFLIILESGYVVKLFNIIWFFTYINLSMVMCVFFLRLIKCYHVRCSTYLILLTSIIGVALALFMIYFDSCLIC